MRLNPITLKTISALGLLSMLILSGCDEQKNATPSKLNQIEIISRSDINITENASATKWIAQNQAPTCIRIKLAQYKSGKIEKEITHEFNWDASSAATKLEITHLKQTGTAFGFSNQSTQDIGIEFTTTPPKGRTKITRYDKNALLTKNKTYGKNQATKGHIDRFAVIHMEMGADEVNLSYSAPRNEDDIREVAKKFASLTTISIETPPPAGAQPVAGVNGL